MDSYDGFVYCVPWGMLLLFLLQDLVSVKFTPVADTDSKTASIVKETRYMCPVTRDVLSNSVPCVLLRPRYMCVVLVMLYSSRQLLTFHSPVCTVRVTVLVYVSMCVYM